MARKPTVKLKLSPQGKKRSKQQACKSQPPPVYSPVISEDLRDLDEPFDSPPETVDSGLSGVMDMLMDISSQLQASEYFMEEVKLDRAADVAWKQRACPAANKLPGQAGAADTTEPLASRDPHWQVAPAIMADILKAVRVKVASKDAPGPRTGSCHHR